MEDGKRRQPSVNAANEDGLSSRRMFVTDRNGGTSYLVETGADISAHPRSMIHRPTIKGEYELFAANGTRIATYGTITVHLNLSLRRAFKWHFTVADVKTPIIVMDFLCHFGLLVDPRYKTLIDTATRITSKGYAASNDEPSIKTICGDSAYHRLLAEYPDLTRPPRFGREKARHSVVHHIETTPGPPVYNKPRRLAPDRLIQVKAEFQLMIERGVMRPSESPRASPLHVVPKNDGNLRPCCDYRALNARTIPDRYMPPHIEDFSHRLHR